MSLKLFHILFIVLATLFCLGFGGWGLLVAPADPADSMSGLRIMGGISTLTGVALLIYGAWFILSKSKKIIN